MQPKPDPKTIGDYYAEWILRKTPPVVRAGLERDYKDHFNRYILPKFRNVAVAELSSRLLEDFRAYLLTERGLALKSVRNIIGATFRACIRDARKVDYLIDRNPFEALMWPRPQQNRPGPFTETERDTILTQFAKRSPFYVLFVHVLFFTGARPSELLGLRWNDVDLRAGYISITKSRYLDEDGATKTGRQ